MKRTIFFTLLLTVFSIGSIFATDITIVKDPPPDPDPLRGVYDVPVSASINPTELSVYFEEPVGTATITVYDEYAQVVAQTIINTAETTEVYLPADMWLSGSYTLTITYGTTTLRGNFQTE